MKRHNLDLNHGLIVQALKQAGASVFSLASVGNGVPDLLVGWRNHNLLIEVKRLTGKRAPSSKLTAAQADFFLAWKGPIHIVTSSDEALKTLEAYQ